MFAEQTRYTIYAGTESGASDARLAFARDFLTGALRVQDIHAYTLGETAGAYAGESEPSLRVEVIGLQTADLERKLATAAQAYADGLGQCEVWITREQISVEIVRGLAAA